MWMNMGSGNSAANFILYNLINRYVRNSNLCSAREQEPISFGRASTTLTWPPSSANFPTHYTHKHTHTLTKIKRTIECRMNEHTNYVVSLFSEYEYFTIPAICCVTTKTYYTMIQTTTFRCKMPVGLFAFAFSLAIFRSSNFHSKLNFYSSRKGKRGHKFTF